MNRDISKIELLDKLDDFLPELVKMKGQIETMIIEIRAFQQGKGVNIDKTKLAVITKAVTTYFDLTMKDLRGKSREGDIMRARHIFCAMVRSKTGMSLAGIGDIVSKDHATVMNSVKAIDNAMETGDLLFDHYAQVERDVNFIFGEL